MFTLHKRQNQHTLFLLWCVTGLGLIMTAGMLFYSAWMTQRASEDAYASMLWKRSADTADRIEAYVRKTLINMAEITAPDNENILPDSEFAADVVIMRRTDNAGNIIGEWQHDPAYTYDWPTELSSNCWTRLHRQLPAIEFLNSAQQLPAIVFHAPIINAGGMAGVLSVLITAETLVTRCFPPIDEPMVSGFALFTQGGRCLVEVSRSDHTDHLRHGKTRRTEPLFTEPAHGDEAYRILRYANTRYLAATAPVITLGGEVWLMETAMPYSTVALAPRALFKSLIILCAWLLPLLAFLGLFSIYRLARTVENEAVTRQQSELDQALAHLTALIENMYGIPFLLAPGDPPELNFISPKIEMHTKLAAIELIANQQAWQNLVVPDYRAAVQKKRHETFNLDVRQTIHYQIQTGAAQPLDVQEVLVPINDSEGKIIHLLGIIYPQTTTDATETTNSAAPTTATIPTTTTTQYHILLADDDRLLAGLCAKYLARAGYGITLAYNGMQALDILKAQPETFDLIILDMIMPKMSGLEAIVHLRQINPDLKIIGISGYSQDGSQWNLRQHNVTAFLPKPFQPEELLRTVAKTLNIAGEAEHVR